MNTLDNIVLCLDTSTEICSVTVACGEKVLAFRENADGKSHAKTLLPFVDEVVKEAGISIREVNAVAVSMGPGSYTGLRIGSSTAKGLCYSLEIPMIAIPTLQIIAAGAAKQQAANENAVFCPMLDARRMEVFTAIYDKDLQPLSEVSSQIVDEHTFADILTKKNVVFCGNAVEKCREILSKNPNALFDTTPISSINMVDLALHKLSRQQFEDIAYFEPFYLKEYVAAKPHVKGLV